MGRKKRKKGDHARIAGTRPGLLVSGSPSLPLVSVQRSCQSRLVVTESSLVMFLVIMLLHVLSINLTSSTGGRCVLLFRGEGYVPVLQERYGVLHEECVVGIGSCPVHPRPSPSPLLVDRVYHLYPTCPSHDTHTRCTCTVNSLLPLKFALSSRIQEP